MSNVQPAASPGEVLRFWFGGSDAEAVRTAPGRWFARDAAFDAQIVARFGPLIEKALAGGRNDWTRRPRSAGALVIVLDQFTRNAFRDTPRMFAGDVRALRVARHIVSRHWDLAYDGSLRWFCYMPFQHSESLDDQRESLRLCAQLRDDPIAGEAFEWAQRHYDVIERFGRFPHRNAILGRSSTPAEIEFLRQPGSSF